MTTNLLWRIESADPSTAPEAVLRAVAAHREVIRAERLPQDPTWPLETLITEMRHVQSDERVTQFNAWEGERVIGHATVFLPLRENTHLAFVDLSVEAAARRQGLAAALLREVVTHAEAQGRSKLVGKTSDRIAAGEAFTRRLGAQAALPMHTNQLDLAELRPVLLDEWSEQGEARAPEYRVWLNAGAYPEERLSEIADLWNVMNTAPIGDLDMEDWQMTPERLREWQLQMGATGEQRLTTFAEHHTSGQLVGFSELFWQPGRDILLFQGATAVRPEHRRHGLGRWIKAANLREALARNAQARFVRTGNADSNQGMLAINYALGFRPFIAQTDWQVETARVREYLGARPGLS
ncbi:GNAT family N-acetyltransferase [Deinococcus peraridilitoris]|uniref:Acetyltransferase (GNAT) family protein n=1 Tax=Deinococcus peraridilitoris (strain DSM 19664 / LMG 22246 / CIP 109416 / KR-200) TaxID=937777 RepID=K9ZXK9_DEIPD|nr:GNAT family N-acetyltransferase [Deinococcus peraridilitoris]AFZ66403.1 acetyltransferase (GNAT) family protein [Deinococcus peraridilitoris DSM 19664]